jgi:hypothetical protein
MPFAKNAQGYSTTEIGCIGDFYMTTRYFGERIKRNEDPRLLTGQGLYVDDVDLPNMLHVAFRAESVCSRADK